MWVWALALSACLRGGAPEGPGLEPPGVRAAAPDDLVYFVMVDRFFNGDPSNDRDVDLADPHAFHGGDLAGVLRKLDYLHALGVRTVWLSPVFEMQDTPFHGWGAFHGYWVRDLRRIEPRFGTEADLVRLGEALEERGMRLVLDMVYNHTSFDAPLREQQPGWFHPDRPIEDWNDPRQLVEHTVHGLPDLDQQNPEVYRYLYDATAMWVDRAGVDGLRIDAVRHMAPEFLRQISGDLHAAYGPQLWVLGEDFQGDPSALSASFDAGGFDATFDFPLRYALTDAVCKGADLRRLAAVFSLDRVYTDPTGLVTFVDNHDVPRAMSECDGDAGRVRVMWSVLFTARGTPALTWGAELGLDGASEPHNRQDMPWERADAVDPALLQLVELRRRLPWLHHAPTVVERAEPGLVRLVRVGPDALVALELGRGAPPSEGLVLGGEGVYAQIRVETAPDPARVAALRAAAGPASVDVRVGETGLTLGPGDSVWLVGSLPELGAWDPDRGVPMRHDGQGWVAQVSGRAGDVAAMKLVIRRQDEVIWEPDADHYVHLGAHTPPLVLRWDAPD